MGDEITNLGTTANPGGGGLTPSSPTFTILPRGRRTLKERLISSISSSDAIWAEAMERLGVTQADIKEMTKEEKLENLEQALAELLGTTSTADSNQADAETADAVVNPEQIENANSVDDYLF